MPVKQKNANTTIVANLLEKYNLVCHRRTNLVDPYKNRKNPGGFM